MESKIIFQGCNINYIYFLFFIISSVTMTLIDRFLFADEIKEKIPDKFTYYTNKEMLDIFLINLADLIAIIPYCIRKRSLRKNNDNKKEEKNIDNESNENKKKVELIYNESKQSATKINQKTIIFYLILIAACDYLKKFIFFLYYLIFPGEEYDTYPSKITFFPITYSRQKKIKSIGININIFPLNFGLYPKISTKSRAKIIIKITTFKYNEKC